MDIDLPVLGKLPEIGRKLKERGAIVVTASPGAGKTTLIPEHLLDIANGIVLLMEPRRLAARAAACRIAELRGETVGKTIGYAVRGESRRSPETRLLAVTPGVLLNMLQDNPLLDGIGAVVLDEFHERQCEADVALALLSDAKRNLRPDLLLTIMSATLDSGAVAAFIGADVIDIPGRLYPLEIRRGRGSSDVRDCPRHVALAVKEILGESRGDILAFLPGTREISTAAAMLSECDAEIIELHGGLTVERQNQALRRNPNAKRRIVLSTNVAESSLTVPGITTVVDSGWEKRPRYNPGAGLSFLEPQRISMHSATQRSGRAARCGEGLAIRLYCKDDERGFPVGNRPEISDCDLAPLRLQVAAWGTIPEKLQWLTAPPVATLKAAEELLVKIGALDDRRMITGLGLEMARLPVHPRLAAMLIRSKEAGFGGTACDIAAILEERRKPDAVDLRLALNEMRRRRGETAKTAARLREQIGCHGHDDEAAGLAVAFAFPEWIARRRTAYGTDFLMAGSGGAKTADPGDLVGCDFIAVAAVDGRGSGESIIRMAAPLDFSDIEDNFPEMFESQSSVEISDSGRAVGWNETRFGAIVVERKQITADPSVLAAALVEDAIRRRIDLPTAGTPGAALLDRVRYAFADDPERYPDWSDKKWPDMLRQAIPLLGECRSRADLLGVRWDAVLLGMMPVETFRELEKDYPGSFKTPAGAVHRIDYSGERPTISAKVQELFGTAVHPTAGRNRTPLRIELLSPAGRPIQVTSDLPGFWRNGWAAVRKEMRSRYPKHIWPENPLDSAPTTRTVKRKGDK
ncbi:MAG: ATP-dependent helicase HrpB [Victivallaceae bacterium]|nr:ATP-dependent helicase HrpB [Victivallaceae bacterium]